jgi:predicted lipid-binding transport protein (Tim44 family)
MGAGLAGGFLGSMLFRSLGGGYGAYAGGPFGSSGFGILEIILLIAAGYFLFKFLTRQPKSGLSPDGYTPSNSNAGIYSDSNDAASLMQKARQGDWAQNVFENLDSNTAMDLFFKIQGAWTNRDLSSIENILEQEAREFLNQDIMRLKSEHRLNRLENIAIREVEPAESWQENGKYYSSMRFAANLLNYTIDENTQQIIEGSKTSPVKFEEVWTFAKESGSNTWKLSAVEQV